MKDYTLVNNELEFLRGSKEHIDELNNKLINDMKTYETRPFLDKKERDNLNEFIGYQGRNQIYATFCFNESGDFIPEAYMAPEGIIKMLYPLGELIADDRRGTIIIDREQYHPNLQSLSAFIYMVDPELYEYYKHSQGFLERDGKGIPTFMYNRKVNNGLRVFKDHFQLVRHLRNKRLLTYCFGPRTAFYLRYFIKTIETHQISNEYSYGDTIENGGNAMKLINLMDKHMAFNTLGTEFELEIDMTDDSYRQMRKLAKKFKTNLPEIRELKNKVMVQRFTKQTMHSRTLFKLTINGAKKDIYKAEGIEPYHHLAIHGDLAIAYIWDTREIEAIVPLSLFDTSHITYNVQDIRTDMVIKEGKATQELWDKVQAIRSEIPVQIRLKEDSEKSIMQ